MSKLEDVEVREDAAKLRSLCLHALHTYRDMELTAQEEGILTCALLKAFQFLSGAAKGTALQEMEDIVATAVGDFNKKHVK